MTNFSFLNPVYVSPNQASSNLVRHIFNGVEAFCAVPGRSWVLFTSDKKTQPEIGERVSMVNTIAKILTIGVLAYLRNVRYTLMAGATLLFALTLRTILRARASDLFPAVSNKTSERQTIDRTKTPSGKGEEVPLSKEQQIVEQLRQQAQHICTLVKPSYFTFTQRWDESTLQMIQTPNNTTYGNLFNAVQGQHLANLVFAPEIDGIGRLYFGPMEAKGCCPEFHIGSLDANTTTVPKIGLAIAAQGRHSEKTYPVDEGKIAAGAVIHNTTPSLEHFSLGFQLNYFKDMTPLIEEIMKLFRDNNELMVQTYGDDAKSFTQASFETAVANSLASRRDRTYGIRIEISGKISYEDMLKLRGKIVGSHAKFFYSSEVSAHCDKHAFTKENQKSAILAGVKAILQGENVYVFCDQGKDRSGILALGMMAVLAGVEYPENPSDFSQFSSEEEFEKAYAPHNKIMQLLQFKRPLINDIYYMEFGRNPQGADKFFVDFYLKNMMEAAREIIEEQKSSPVRRELFVSPEKQGSGKE